MRFKFHLHQINETWLWISLFIFYFSVQASAHPFDLGLLQVQMQNDKIQFSLQLEAQALSEIVGMKADTLLKSDLNTEKDFLLAGTLGEAQVKLSEGLDCRWQESTASRVADQIRLDVTALCERPVESWSLQLPFLRHSPKTFEIVAKITADHFQLEQTASLTSPQLTVDRYSPNINWTQFISMGIHHIGAVPSEWWDNEHLHFPEGIDHILFVIALVLAGGGWLAILKTVTGFTLGHSLTLALATIGVVQIQSRWVESAIALSICLVALESLFLKNSKQRWRIAFLFGLIHGLGFASALSELHLKGSALTGALLGFNLGVEIGQCVIVAAILPLIYLTRLNVKTQKYTVPVLASVIFAIGGFWFVQRVFEIKF